jgi:hypothetical protein
MICPHCDRALRRRERTDHRCGWCGRRFVFDPADDPSRISDLRVLRTAAWLSDNGRFRFTWAQLLAAVRRGSMPSSFHSRMLSNWPAVHGSLPAGLVDAAEARAASGPPGEPVAHVLCRDADVRDCLLANDVQRIFDVLVVVDGLHVPDGHQPVLVFDTFVDTDDRFEETDGAHARVAELRRAGRRVIAVGPATGRQRLVGVRPATLLDWLDLTVRAEARYRAGARRAADVDFLNWPPPG